LSTSDSASGSLSIPHKVLSWITLPLILLTPLVGFLQYNDYGFLSPEVMILLISMSGIGLVGSLVGKIGGRIVTALIYALTFTLFLDLQFESLPFISKRHYAKEFIAIGLVISFGLAFLMANRVSLILGTGFSTVLLMSMILPVSSLPEVLIRNDQSLGVTETEQRKLPLYLHIILDAHIGPEGLPQEISEAQEFKEQLKEFYLENGFRLYGNAYSQHFNTSGALAQVYSLSSKIAPPVWDEDNIEYLRQLAQKGFKINSYSTYELDHCSDKRINYTSCYFYDGLAVSHVKSLGLETSEQLIVLLKSFLYSSLVYQKLAVEANKLRKRSPWFSSIIPYWNWERNVRVQPVASMKTLGVMKNELEEAKLGDMFIAHLLLPHAPYIFSSECQPGKLETWYNRVPLTGVNTPETRRERYLFYIQQATCTLSELQKIFDIMKKKRMFDNAIIVIHGDHGSRINVVEPKNRSLANPMSDRDFRDAFSTLAAIKTPNSKRKYDLTPITISQLIQEFVASGINIPPIPQGGIVNETVFMSDLNNTGISTVSRDFLGGE